MANIVPPVEVDPVEGNTPPPVVTPPKGDENSVKMSEMIALQMKAFQENLMAQFNGDYTEKLNKLNADNSELEDKKHRLAVAETLRASDMDSEFLDFVYDKDPEIVKVKIKQLSDLMTIAVNKGITERLIKSSYTPPGGTGSGDFGGISSNKPKYFV